MAGRRVPYNPKPRLNDRSNRVLAVAEEQAMELTATLLAENDADLQMLREISARMRRRPLPVTAEDDCDLDLMRRIHARMERRVQRIRENREVTARIARMVA